MAVSKRRQFSAEKVRFWLRNVDRKSNAFWLQLSGARFYPDFLALLTDGRIAAVEYKGKSWSQTEDAAEKRMIGDLWAEASEGRCIFDMPTAGDFSSLDAMLKAEI